MVVGVAGLLASLVVTPAVAADVRFSLTSDVTPGSVSWLLPQPPAPSFFVDDFYFVLDGPILGTFQGTELGDGILVFEGFAFLADGGFNTFAFIAPAPGPADFSLFYGLELSGDRLFTGGTAAPTFRLGTFDLTGACLGVCGADRGGFTLTISAAAAAVPEPATWAMMILGFGGIGAVVRLQAKGAEAGRRTRA
jgi:hypothetical protein